MNTSMTFADRFVVENGQGESWAHFSKLES